MHSIILKCGLILTAAAQLLSCSQSVPLLPEAAPVPVSNASNAANNTICNHNFNVTSQNLQPLFVEKETTTVVDGSTPVELLRSLKTSTDSYQGQGNTKWTVSWSFDLRRTALGCRLENLETQTNVNYHFPIWSGQLLAQSTTLQSPDLTNQWNAYSDALRVHHCKHGKTGIDASLEVAARLGRLTPTSSCDVLQQNADELARSVIGVYKLVEADFTPPDMQDYFKR